MRVLVFFCAFFVPFFASNLQAGKAAQKAAIAQSLSLAERAALLKQAEERRQTLLAEQRQQEQQQMLERIKAQNEAAMAAQQRQQERQRRGVQPQVEQQRMQKFLEQQQKLLEEAEKNKATEFETLIRNQLPGGFDTNNLTKCIENILKENPRFDVNQVRQTLVGKKDEKPGTAGPSMTQGEKIVKNALPDIPKKYRTIVQEACTEIQKLGVSDDQLKERLIIMKDLLTLPGFEGVSKEELVAAFGTSVDGSVFEYKGSKEDEEQLEEALQETRKKFVDNGQSVPAAVINYFGRRVFYGSRELLTGSSAVYIGESIYDLLDAQYLKDAYKTDWVKSLDEATLQKIKDSGMTLVGDADRKWLLENPAHQDETDRTKETRRERIKTKIEQGIRNLPKNPGEIIDATETAQFYVNGTSVSHLSNWCQHDTILGIMDKVLRQNDGTVLWDYDAFLTQNPGGWRPFVGHHIAQAQPTSEELDFYDGNQVKKGQFVTRHATFFDTSFKNDLDMILLFDPLKNGQPADDVLQAYATRGGFGENKELVPGLCGRVDRLRALTIYKEDMARLVQYVTDLTDEQMKQNLQDGLKAAFNTDILACVDSWVTAVLETKKIVAMARLKHGEEYYGLDQLRFTVLAYLKTEEPERITQFVMNKLPGHEEVLETARFLTNQMALGTETPFLEHTYQAHFTSSPLNEGTTPENLIKNYLFTGRSPTTLVDGLSKNEAFRTVLQAYDSVLARYLLIDPMMIGQDDDGNDLHLSAQQAKVLPFEAGTKMSEITDQQYRRMAATMLNRMGFIEEKDEEKRK